MADDTKPEVVEEFARSFQALVTVLSPSTNGRLIDQMEEMKAAAEVSTHRLLEAARSLEHYFARKYVLFSTFFPEEVLKEDWSVRMMKVVVVFVSVIVTRVMAQTGAGAGAGGGAKGGPSNTPCTTVTTGGSSQRQLSGKKCADMSKDDCWFIHDAISCCSECADPNSRTQNQQKQCIGRRRKCRGKRRRKGCFHGDDMVHTREYGALTIQQLAEHRDAHVLTRNDDGQLEYSSVRYWLHAQPTVSMKFLVLTTQSGHRLSITADHLIYQTDCRGGDGRAIFAKNVQLGRCLYVNENGKLKETRVIERDQKKMTGIYSPITTTGSIVVNDVLASCYNYYENESLQKFIYQYVISFQDVLADWLPTSIYEAAFNSQNGMVVTVPRVIFNFLHLSKYFLH